MPLYSVYILSQKTWPFGEILCDLWLSLDYTACLCSIYTVFCITVDRFCSIRMPARYRVWRTKRKISILIGGVSTQYLSVLGWIIGLPLTSNLIFYSSTCPSTLTSTRVLVNTGSTLIQAVNIEEGCSGLVSQRIWGPKGSRPWSSVTPSLSTGSRLAVANKIARPKLYIDFNNSLSDCKNCNRK